MPEVETVRRELEPWLSGRRIAAIERLAPAGPKYADLERAVGQRIEGVGRRGKFLVLPLSAGDELIIHLGMTGVISHCAPTGTGARHVRVVMRLEGDEPTTLHFQDIRRFGRFLVVPAGEYDDLPTLAALGPEPLDPDLSPRRFHAELQRSKVAIKPYLLSQRPVAGVGNIYADEALWAARIHPLTPARSISKAKAATFLAALREVLEASIAAQGTTFDDYRTVGGEAGSFAGRLKVYGRGGDACLRCGGQLRKSVIGGRGTVHCPRCQRLPRQVGAESASRASGR